MAMATGLPLPGEDKDVLNVTQGATNGGAGTASVESKRYGTGRADVSFFDSTPIPANTDEDIAKSTRTTRLNIEGTLGCPTAL
jgi:hypothetical protein